MRLDRAVSSVQHAGYVHDSGAAVNRQVRRGHARHPLAVGRFHYYSAESGCFESRRRGLAGHREDLFSGSALVDKCNLFRSSGGPGVRPSSSKRVERPTAASKSPLRDAYITRAYHLAPHTRKASRIYSTPVHRGVGGSSSWPVSPPSEIFCFFCPVFNMKYICFVLYTIRCIII